MASVRNARSRRIFGGAIAQPAGRYDRQLLNNEDQATAEALAVGTHRRVFPGPKGLDNWSYFVSVTGAAGAASSLKFYFSNLPNPDPTVAAHWKDSGIAAIDLTAVAETFATRSGDYPEWVMAEAVVAVSGGSMLAYVRVAGMDE